MPTKECIVCHRYIPIDSQDRFLNHAPRGSTTKCPGSNSHVTEWASEEDRLAVEGSKT